MKKGEEKEFTVDFPKEYHAKNMQGKKVKFKITVNRVEEKKEQVLDDSMVAQITGKTQSVDEFKKMVEENLKAEMEQKGKAEHENAVVAEILKITKTELPDAMIDQELDRMIEEQKKRIGQQGLTWEKYLDHIKKTEEDFRVDHRKNAEDRIKAQLGVHNIIQDAKIETSDDEVNAKIQEMVAKYPADQQDQVRDHFLKDPQAYRGLKYNLSADKLFDMLTK
jgi:trigger factor